MITKEFDFLDDTRQRQVPVIVYLPFDYLEKSVVQTVIYSPGYYSQEDLAECASGEEVWPHKNNTYLAKFFTDNGFAFISIQHDMLGDKDGLESIDPKAVQAIARKHLWERGIANVFFAIAQLKKQNLKLDLEKFIIGGHSNGGDIAKYFANHNDNKVSHVIVCDGRRCPIASDANIKILMFEADDTTTDEGVIPGKGDPKPGERINLEWVIVKPKNALHAGYSDSGADEEVKERVCQTIKWFLGL